LNDHHRPVAGVLFCIGSLLLFAIQDSLIKELSQRYPVLEVLTLRSLIVLLMLVVIAVALYGRRVLVGRKHRLLMLRGVLAFGAFTSYYVALRSIPLADAASVYMTAPLFVTLLSALLLREHVDLHRWIAVAVGFCAVLIILNPGSSVFRIEAAIPLFSALCYATIPIINRHIGLSEHAMTMGIYTTAVFLTLVSLLSLALQWLPAPAPGNDLVDGLFQAWLPMTAADLALSCAAGAVFSCALLSITQAYRIARVATVAPFEYSYLVWVTLLGYLMFGDIPGPRVVFGAALVVLCGLYIIYREQRRRMP
jgi:drug/metabolite transporter (DMT)-like permease